MADWSWTAPPAAPVLPGRFATQAAFEADPRPNKMLLRTGLCWSGPGRLEALPEVTAAKRWLLEQPRDPDYLPLDGPEAFGQAVAALVPGTVIGTPGGTGAARLLAAVGDPCTWWVPDPGWPNHARLARHAGHAVRTYRWDVAAGRVDIGALHDDLQAVAPGDVVLVHAAVHNPTGIDLDAPGWRALTACVVGAGAMPLLDVAFLGFKAEPEAELAPALALARAAGTAAWTLSFGKSLGLYDERVGALVLRGPQAQVLAGHARSRARALWSSPPAHGARVAARVLQEHGQAWRGSMARLRQRLAGQREVLVAALRDQRVPVPPAVEQGTGLFATVPMSAGQVAHLRDAHALYVGPTGGLNLSVPSEAGLHRLAAAIGDARRHLPG